MHHALDNVSIPTQQVPANETMWIVSAQAIRTRCMWCEVLASHAQVGEFFSVNDHLASADTEGVGVWNGAITYFLQYLFPEPSIYEDTSLHTYGSVQLAQGFCNLTCSEHMKAAYAKRPLL